MKAILTHSLILVMLSGCSQGDGRFAGKWTGNYGGMRQTFTITPLQANTYHISVPGPFGLSKEYDATYNGKKSLTTQAGATFDLVEDNMLMVCDPGGCNRLYREGGMARILEIDYILARKLAFGTAFDWLIFQGHPKS